MPTSLPAPQPPPLWRRFLSGLLIATAWFSLAIGAHRRVVRYLTWAGFSVLGGGRSGRAGL
jgi:hypothetical protein